MVFQLSHVFTSEDKLYPSKNLPVVIQHAPVRHHVHRIRGMVSVGAVIANRIRLLLLSSRRRRRHHIPIQMVMVVRPHRLMRMLVDVVLLGVVVVVEVVKCCIFPKRLLLLLLMVGMRVRISGEMLLGGYGREVVVGLGWERRLAATEVERFFRDGGWNVGVGAQFTTADSRWTGASQRV